MEQLLAFELSGKKLALHNSDERHLIDKGWECKKYGWYHKLYSCTGTGTVFYTIWDALKIQREIETITF